MIHKKLPAKVLWLNEICKILSAQTKQVWPSWLLCRTWMLLELLGPVLYYQAFSYHSTLNLSSQIWSSTEICMIVCCCSNDEVYIRVGWVVLRIEVRIGPILKLLFSPWKKMVGYHPLAVSGLTRVLFTRWIQIENFPLKKHDF